MKCKIIRDDMVVSVPGGVNSLPGHLQEQTEVREVTANGRTHPRAFWKVGSVLTHPDAFRLVQMGCALPADEECATAANRSTLQLAAAQAAYERTVRGIMPEDFDLYNAGIIEGYTGDDTVNDGYKPGPNWHLYLEQKRAAEADEEEDE